MEIPNLSSLESLTDIGLKGGLDMRPTLLRVLTDLYVQKLTHNAQEERHYTELALRLLDSVDVATRSAVAARLARHLSPPAPVMKKLAADLPEVAAALRSHASPPKPQSPAEDARPIANRRDAGGDCSDDNHSGGKVPTSIEPALAGELNELFFAAGADARRLILLNLDVVAPAPARARGIARDPAVGLRLETAVLGRRHEEFERELARALSISRALAQRIARDELGEPIVVAAKALNMPRDPVCRILMFINTAVGHSVQRVHALAALHDQMTARAARDLVGIWQALSVGAHDRAAAHQPVSGTDQDHRVRPAAPRRPAALPLQRRREAS